MPGTTGTLISSASSWTGASAGDNLNDGLANILAEYLERFSGVNGQLSDKSRLNDMFGHTRSSHPSQITTRALLGWITRDDPANNTVRARLSTSRTFLRWCVQCGIIETSPADHLPNLTKQYPTTYGKVQQKNPARFLTYDEAFVQLIGACQDGTDTGLRDEIIVRLGLSGMRVTEIAELTVGALTQLPSISWTGKGNRPRQLVAGDALCHAIQTWLRCRSEHAGPPQSTTALLLPCVPATVHEGAYRKRKAIDRTSSRTLHKSTLWHVVTTRARIAGLGHVSPHDLRRSAAAILHNSTTNDGAHRFDLLDIQRVLGHADPATTMRSYLEPMDTAVSGRAAVVLD